MRCCRTSTCRATASLRFELRIAAAWLWSGRAATIAGAAAAALHGAKWIPENVPVELIHANNRPPPGVLTRRGALLDGETQILGRARRHHARADCLRHRPARCRSFGGGAPGRARARNGFQGRRRAARRQMPSSHRRAAAAGDRAGSGRPGCAVTARELPAAASHRRGAAAAADPDTGVRRGRHCRSPTSTWAGKNTWSPSNTTATIIGPTGANTSKTFGGWRMLERMGWIVVRVVAEDHPADIVRRVRTALAACECALRASSVSSGRSFVGVSPPRIHTRREARRS